MPGVDSAAIPIMTPFEAGRRIFARVLVGIDGSQQALEAARQAALLQDVDGELTLLSAWGGEPADLQRTTAEEALLAASEYVAPYSAATGLLVPGPAAAALLEAIDRDERTLVAVGSSGCGRLLAAVEGAVATEIIREAPCAVLVARPVEDGFPHHVVVEVDGVHRSATAYAAARYVAERFGAGLRAVAAASTQGEAGEASAEALTRKAEGADLLVVGRRDLGGRRARDPFAEQVARHAPCSTLVVRETRPA